MISFLMNSAMILKFTSQSSARLNSLSFTEPCSHPTQSWHRWMCQRNRFLQQRKVCIYWVGQLAWYWRQQIGLNIKVCIDELSCLFNIFIHLLVVYFQDCLSDISDYNQRCEMHKYIETKIYNSIFSGKKPRENTLSIMRWLWVHKNSPQCRLSFEGASSKHVVSSCCLSCPHSM